MCLFFQKVISEEKFNDKIVISLKKENGHCFLHERKKLRISEKQTVPRSQNLRSVLDILSNAGVIIHVLFPSTELNRNLAVKTVGTPAWILLLETEQQNRREFKDISSKAGFSKKGNRSL